MLRHAIIQFSRWDRSYEPGEIVSGYISIRLHSNKMVKGFYAELTGQAKTSFSSGILICTGNEIYVQERIDFVSARSDNHAAVLNAGIHKYYFDFVLPNDIPDTVSRECGKISYIIKFNVDRPWSRGHKIFREFYVKNHASAILPESPKIKIPFHMTYWCGSGEIIGFMELACTVHKRGSEIPVELFIRNHSSLEISKIACRLTKKIEYGATWPEATIEYYTLPMTTKDLHYKINRGQRKVLNLQVPIPNSLDNLAECTLMTDHYIVELFIHILGGGANIHCSTPIQIVP